VSFSVEQQQWSHAFDVEHGSTIRQLKQQMLSPKGTDEDIDSFELRLLGHRVPDWEQIHLNQTLDFSYLGPEEGERRARQDKLEKAASSAPASNPESRQTTTENADASEPLPAVGGLVSGISNNTQEQASATESDQQQPAAPSSSKQQDRTTSSRQQQVTKTSSNPQQPSAASDESGKDAAQPLYTPAVRPPATQLAPALAQRWKVVGGADKGGILVREGRSISSRMVPDRLSHGSLVEELRKEGERLQYRKLQGAGPDSGWVSLTMSGKELLSRSPPSPEDLFTLDRALALQEDLMEGFAQPSFQASLRTLHCEFEEQNGLDGMTFQLKRNELLLTVQATVLPKYGFEGTPAGLVRMMKAFGPYIASKEVVWNNEQLNKLLPL